MTDLLKKFKCKDCGIVGRIELLHKNAFTTSEVVLDDEGDIMLLPAEINHYEDAHFRCAHCDLEILVDNNEDDLQSMLENMEG